MWLFTITLIAFYFLKFSLSLLINTFNAQLQKNLSFDDTILYNV